MINSKKKGFTIVELVIVIAVIAVLSAVLIPTFSNLVRKAQEAADLQLAKNLNTALTMAEAEGKEIAEFSDVLEVLYEEGYVVANLNPTAEDNWYAWDESTNQILYLNSNFEILFQSREAGNKEKWIIGVGTSEDRDTVLAAQIKAYFTPNNTDDLNSYLNEVLDQISNGEITGEQKVIFGGNVNFDNNPLYKVDNAAANLTFDLAGATLGGTLLQDTAPILITAGDLTIKNGTITAEGKHSSDDGTSQTLTSSVQYGVHGNQPANMGTLTVTDMEFDTQGTAVRVYFGTASVSNTTISASDGQSVYAGAGATITLSNVTANIKNYRNIFASNYAGSGYDKKQAKIIIENGTYNMYSDANDHYNLNVYHGAEIEINDGIFGSYDADGVYSSRMFCIDQGTIKITGGIFNGKLFNTLTETEWKQLCQNMNITVTGAGSNNVVLSK